MKTPAFWTSRNAVSTALLPLAELYDIASTLRRARINPVKLPVPVICIGNLTAGGAGKTPVALHIGQWLKSRNVNAYYLSRGYGGKMPGPLRVDIVSHRAGDVGDEPLLLAKTLPTIISKDRLAGAKLAISQGATAIIMDDGFQNPSIEKNLSFLVVDGKNGFGNERLLPAGPLRESLQGGFARAQAIIVIDAQSALPLPKNKPIINARTSFDQDVRGRKLLAFAGLAYPQKFFEALQKAGAQLVDTIAFADHHAYSESEIASLRTRASAMGAIPVTTAKDIVRLTPASRLHIAVAELVLTFDQAGMLEMLLTQVMK